MSLTDNEETVVSITVSTGDYEAVITANEITVYQDANKIASEPRKYAELRLATHQAFARLVATIYY